MISEIPSFLSGIAASQILAEAAMRENLATLNTALEMNKSIIDLFA